MTTGPRQPRQELPIPDDVAPCAAWTDTMLELAEWIGAAAALRLVAAYGGTELYVPIQVSADNPIAGVIGLPAARRLAEIYGRERLQLPVGRAALEAARRAPILAEVRAGRLSKQQAAMKLGTSTRYVRSLMNDAPRLAGPAARQRSERAATAAEGRPAAAAQLDLLADLDD